MSLRADLRVRWSEVRTGAAVEWVGKRRRFGRPHWIYVAPGMRGRFIALDHDDRVWIEIRGADVSCRRTDIELVPSGTRTSLD
jgi:hypothetical protein